MAADKRRIPEEEKSGRVGDILNLILPANAVLHIAFPIHRYTIPYSHVVCCVSEVVCVVEMVVIWK